MIDKFNILKLLMAQIIFFDCMKHIRRLLMILFSNRVVGLNIPMHDTDLSYHALGTVVTVVGYTT